LADLKVAREYYLPGYYNNSRRIGSSVRLVLSDSFRWPKDMKWYPDYEDGLYDDKARLAKKYDELIAQNEKLIRKQKLQDWLPNGKLRNADGTVQDISYSCGDFAHSNGPTKLGLVTVATINLQDSAPNLTRTSIVGESGQVFASKNNLYIANEHWWWWPAPGQTDYTYLHKFDITDPNKAVYVASGGVDGHIVDQFSMDEDSAGFFRVATTISSRVADQNNPWGRIETTNKISVLGENNGALNVVGQTPEIAKGERIFSSRLLEGKGYVVTYHQVDPFFTVDLSDPTNPHVVGELKIPGFSTYIHPLDADHVLTIGTYIPENSTDWRLRSLQLAIFDVSDFANPKQTFTQKVGDGYSWSEAAYDHHAFNYFKEKKQLAIPFYDWDYQQTGDGYWSTFKSEIRVFGIDTQTGITPVGSLSMADLYQSYSYNNWTWYWSPWVRRSVMADNYVYAISDAGIRVADIANLSQPVATVQFDGYSYP
ncbi:MAG: beta-propeller domain-containing protein, partial [Myxococcaceae bacterium]